MSKRKRVSRTSNNDTSSLKREIKKLKSDLKKAQKENVRLRQAMAKKSPVRRHPKPSTPSNAPQAGSTSPYEALLREGAAAGRRYASSTYGRYLFQSVKESSLGRWVRRIYTFFRRLRVVRIVANIALVILTFLLASAFFVTAIPFLILATLVALLAVVFTATSMNRQMRSALSGKHIFVFVPHDNASLGEDSFMERCAKDMADDPHVAVLVVSPHLLSARGLGGHGLYFTARKECERLYLVRKSYYFIVRRRVLEVVDPHFTVIY